MASKKYIEKFFWGAFFSLPEGRRSRPIIIKDVLFKRPIYRAYLFLVKIKFQLRFQKQLWGH